MLKKLLFLAFLFKLLTPLSLVGQCSASFTNTANYCQGDSIQFSFTGTGSSVEWNFGDTFSGIYNLDTNKIVKHKFSDTGFYTIQLIANDTGCADTVYNTIRIVKKTIPNFSWTNPCSGQLTAFNNTTLKDAADSFKTFAWQFGDSSFSGSQNPNHTYQSYGNKTVKFIITTLQGCQDSITKTVSVKAPLRYSASLDSACLFSKANFTSTYGSTVPTAWQWNFGDGGSASASEPDYAYSTAGMFHFNLTTTYADGSTCKANYDSIWIISPPDADFSILTDTVQCFKGNQTCIKFNKNPQSIAVRNILWDDGSTSTPSANDTQVCYSYNNDAGGQYRITSELVDAYGCANRVKDSTYIKVLKDPKAKLALNYSGGCFKTFLSANNISNMQPPLIKRFIWDFGDGSLDSVNWNAVSHTYINDGIFTVKLFIEDTFGCTDLYTDSGSIQNINYVIDPQVTRLQKCRLDNSFKFTQTPIPNGSITWYFGDVGYNAGNYGDADTAITFTATKHYWNIGAYITGVKLSKYGCDSFLRLDTSIVHGPLALSSIQNRYQCQIQDTVYFNNVSTTFRNASVQTKWKVWDPFANNCEIDTKNGINIDSNCNNSVDSLTFKHWFTKGKEGCYSMLIIQTDTTVGCADSTYYSLPLMPPKADSGMFLSYASGPCIGPERSKEVFLNLGTTQPNCGRESWQVMWDSTCASESGNFNSNWVLNDYRHNYDYNNLPCDTNGYVTIGLIIRNGRDTNGQVCYDTGFYHHIIKLGKLSPIITTNYNPNQTYCNYTPFTFSFRDSLHDSMSLIVWDFGDGTKKDTVSNLSSQTHIYTKPGTYTIKTFLRHINGCEGNDSFSIKVGINKLYNFPKNEMCLGDSVPIQNISRYWKMGSSYFADSARERMGKETTRWDIGDGNGFSKTGSSVYLKYDKIGDYTLKMETKDSVGCLDTLTIPVKARVFSVKSNIKTLLDTLICAQTVQLFSSSYVYDSINNFVHADDSVFRYVWTFSDSSGASVVKNPTKFFGKGNQTIKLVSENTRGCRDSSEATILVLTPIANFSVLSDTSGCQPFLANFKNNSQNANNYKWLYKNAANNTFNTASAADVTFNYTQYGTFYPQLIAIRNAVNNGIPISCSDTFPAPNTTEPKVVINVFEKPVVRFTYSTNCDLYTTAFQNTTVINTDTAVSYLWTFGNGDSSTLQNPTQVFADTGSYRIVLRISVSRGCIDSFVQTIIMSPRPSADFNFTEVCRGVGTKFTDVSEAYNDNIYIWNWSFGDGATSNLKNPTRTYNTDSTYKVFLRVTNRAGCIDTITKFVDVFVQPTPQFNFLNACKNDALIFDNTSTAKNDALQFNWSFGDGTSTTQKNPTKIYADTGNYSVKMVVNTIKGCTDSIAKMVRTYPLPKADFSIANSDQCLNGNQFNFTNLSTIAVDSISYNYWKASDGGSGFNKDYQTVFTQADSFSITLINLTNRGCRDTIQKSILVRASPSAKISLDKQSQCVFTGPINFVDTSLPKGLITSRIWDINNQFTKTDSSFYYEFLTDGTKNIKLIVTHESGCQDSMQTNIIIHPKPKAVLKVDYKQLCLNGNTFFLSDSSWVKSGTAVNNTIYISNGDSLLSNQYSYSFNKADTYFLENRVSSNFGCLDTAKETLIVHPHPLAKFIIDTANLCLRSNVFTFNNRSTVKGTKQGFTWVFDDNTTQSDTHVTKSFASYGVKQIKMIATSTFGCKDSLTKSVEVYPMPIAKVYINDTAQCFNTQNFIFKDTSTIAYHQLARLWIWNDQLTDTSKTIKKVFNSDTLYQHQLISISEKSCADTLQFTQRVLPLPKPNFVINNAGQCINNQNFVFSNTSTSKQSISNYYWDFGDGNSSQNTSPSHVFGNTGIYQIQLVAKTNRNCLDTIVKSIEVYHKPNAVLTVNNAAQCFNTQNFVFTGNSSIISGSIDQYEWDTSNQSFFGSKDTVLTFPTPGKYTITYVPISNQQCRDTAYLPIVVNPNPVADFSINDTLQCANSNNFIFLQNASIIYGNLDYNWYLDNLFEAQGSGFNKTFAQADTILTKLVVNSDKGCVDSSIKTIYISPIPKTDFAINNEGQCLYVNLFKFSNLSNIADGTLKYIWDFGDQFQDTNKNTSHQYAQHGGFDVTLKATSNWGCVFSQTKSVNIHPEPTASFSINDPGQCLDGNIFKPTNSSSIDSTSFDFEWHWGDGTSNVNTNPNHTYAVDSTYLIKLRVWSTYNCMDFMESLVSVNPMPKPAILINSRDQCINTQQYVFTNNSTIKKGKIATFQWRIEGNIYDDIGALNYYFNNSGPRTISLTNWSDSGCLASIEEAIRIWPKPMAEIIVNDSVQCLRGNNFIFENTSFDSFGHKGTVWINANQTIGRKDSLHLSYPSSGNKTLAMITTSVNNCSDTASISVRVKPMPNPNFEILNQHYCEDNLPISLIPEQMGGYFSGKNIINQQYVPRILWKDTVKYTISQEGCLDSSIQYTEVLPLPKAFLGNDTTVCKHETILLHPVSWNSTFTWQDGSKDSVYRAIKPGIYTVTATNICGEDQASIIVSIRDYNCRIYIPTAFTPNRNGINDYYRPITFEMDNMHYTIFNRWGEKIYEGDNNGLGWDGSYMDKMSPEGYYVVVVNYNYTTELRTVKETVHEVFYLLK